MDVNKKLAGLRNRIGHFGPDERLPFIHQDCAHVHPHPNIASSPLDKLRPFLRFPHASSAPPIAFAY
ncbi:MAG: hypothetical protein KJ579_11975, partial [Verrucomicrobia bacterium]|nr:hypothetical protein [Verrucomicrobiota bacterium]